MEKKIEYGMVDLGLPSGLKWADRNVGAATPEDFGDYFMWGSTTPDTDNVCDWEHTPFNNGSEDFDEEYFNAHKSEWLDGDLLKSEYDAAHAAMGGSWRMPTPKEIQELLKGTTQTTKTLNGIAGIRFISKANATKSIFVPFAGFRCDSYVHFVGNLGYVLSSSLHAISASYSQYLVFICYGDAVVYYDYRYVGYVVRGVCYGFDGTDCAVAASKAVRKTANGRCGGAI